MIVILNILCVCRMGPFENLVKVPGLPKKNYVYDTCPPKFAYNFKTSHNLFEIYARKEKWNKINKQTKRTSYWATI